MLSSRSGTIYQQDNALPHTTRLSQQCLQGYDVHLWPARSPDLSPIDSSPPGGATGYQLLHRSIHRQVANMVAKNDANLAPSPTFLYVSIESQLQYLGIAGPDKEMTNPPS
ncbi:hypothetical protein TNCV_3113381 [Trichonephila clavipes]|nr:hypothetical protein TNCV_3113381 [Trichonephila clavipes]